MIIDSHAHYNNNAYKKPFRYLSDGEDGYSFKEGDQEQLFRELQDANIPYSIEPGVSLQSCGEVPELAAQYPGRIFPAVGFHPTRSIFETWSDRHKLDAYANKPGVIHCFYGAKEPKSIRDSAKLLREAIPGSRMEILPGLRHGDLSQNEPEWYAKNLTDWIGE